MPRDRTNQSRRDRRTHRSEDLDTRGSGYSHRDSRNLQHEAYSRSRTNHDDYMYHTGSEPYIARSEDQGHYNRDASSDGDDELSQSDTTGRPSEWGRIPYQDPIIKASPSVASDSTLVHEVPAFDARPLSGRRRRHQSPSRDRCYVNYDSEILSDPSRPFPAERSYSPSPDRHSARTNNTSQRSQGYADASSTRNRQRDEDHSYPADHYNYEMEDCSQVFHRTIRYMDEEYRYHPDEEQQGSSSSTARIRIWPAPPMESVQHESPSHEHPNGRIIYNFRSKTRR